MKIIILLLVSSIFLRLEASDLSPESIKSHFNKEHENCFAIKEIGVKKIFIFKESQCKKRETPYSTYKILHSLIALETRAIKGDKTIIKWDGKKKFLKSWEKDHNINTAIRHSVVPFFQETAKRIGKLRMSKYLSLIKYGNQKVGDKIDRFWLDGPLKVSALEQLEFLESLYLSKLPFKKKHQEFVREIIQLDKSWRGYALSGKTGSAYYSGGFQLGWFLGHLKKGEKQFVFVIRSKGKGEAGNKLISKAKSIFREMKL